MLICWDNMDNSITKRMTIHCTSRIAKGENDRHFDGIVRIRVPLYRDNETKGTRVTADRERTDRKCVSLYWDIGAGEAVIDVSLCWESGTVIYLSVYVYVVCVSLSFVRDITDRRHLQSVALLRRLKA